MRWELYYVGGQLWARRWPRREGGFTWYISWGEIALEFGIQPRDEHWVPDDIQ